MLCDFESFTSLYITRLHYSDFVDSVKHTIFTIASLFFNNTNTAL